MSATTLIAVIGGVVVVVGIVLAYASGVGRFKIGSFEVSFDSAVASIRDRLPDPVQQRGKRRIAVAEDRQYALMREYHAQGLAQAKISFWFSLLAACLGFVAILGAILMAVLNPGQVSAAAVSLIAGVVIDGVSGLFFVQSNRARRLMTDFFSALRADRKLDECLTLVDNIQDAQMRDRLQALLGFTFVDVQHDPSLLQFISSSAAHTTSADTAAEADDVVPIPTMARARMGRSGTHRKTNQGRATSTSSDV